MNDFHVDFAFANGRPSQVALFRQSEQDFVVEEDLGFELSGSGEHLYLQVRKTNENTDWVAKQLAEHFGVQRMDVGYAGKKDRRAVTTQWFSVYLPGKTHAIDWVVFQGERKLNAELLAQHSHDKKLKPGMHRGNYFRICLRECAETSELVERLKTAREQGVPNYFGEQRFGRDAGNLFIVNEWIQSNRSPRNKNIKNLAVSALRSYLFNLVLDQRIKNASWTKILEGEIESFPSGPLWGRGRSSVQAVLAELEDEVLLPYLAQREFLEHRGFGQERRALVLLPQNLQWRFFDNNLELSFYLAPGYYATSVLRELVELRQEEVKQSEEAETTE